MDNIFFSDIKNIILDTSICEFLILSDKLFENEISYLDFHKHITNYQPIKKYVFYIIHYIRSYRGIKEYNYFLNKDVKLRNIIENNILNYNFDYVFKRLYGIS